MGFVKFRDQFRTFAATAAPIAGAAAGTVFGGPVGTAVGAQVGGAAGAAIAPKQRAPAPPAPPGTPLADASGFPPAPSGFAALGTGAKVAIGAGVAALIALATFLIARRK